MAWDFKLVDGPYGGTTEGPAWDESGLLFTHIPSSRILRYDPARGASSVYLKQTSHANGLMLDREGALYACEGGARRVVKYSAGGVTVIADAFGGKRLNIPNDLAIDDRGRVWFTDPFYEGVGGAWSENPANKDLDHDSVYRVDPQSDGSWSISRATFDTTRPNGLLFSLDHRTLYVAQSDRGPDRKRELRAYPVRDDGSLGGHAVLHDFGAARGIDGMVLDVEGNVIATVGNRERGPGPMICVFSPSGELIETHPTPEDQPTNCTFGGADLSTLYVTTGDGHLLEARTERQGRLHYPPS